MFQLQGSLKIVNTKLFDEAVSKDFAEQASRNSSKIASIVSKEIGGMIREAIYNSPTTISLLRSSLRDDFGVTSSEVESAMRRIVEYIASAVLVSVNKKGKYASVRVDIIKAEDMTKIAALPEGSRQEKGGAVPWLYWLLTRGTQVVVGDFWLYPYAKGRTRSGGTKIMRRIEGTKRDPFRVDPTHAGNLENNFITRAIENKADDILNSVANAMIGVFK